MIPFFNSKMLLKVLAEVNPTGRKDSQSYSLLGFSDMESFVPMDRVELIKVYTGCDPGIDWDFGGTLFDTIMFEAGFCKDSTHLQAWSHETHDNKDNCTCDFLADGPAFVVFANGKQYLVHPEEKGHFADFIKSKRHKKEV